MSHKIVSRPSMKHPDTFEHRHIGPDDVEIDGMLSELRVKSLEALIDEIIPSAIRLDHSLDLPEALTEGAALKTLAKYAAYNRINRSFIGMGYSEAITPPVIQRNILENPGWYTPYTPYQAELSQGRLEALLNFQTMVTDLTHLPVANASLLDEATAAAEAMGLSYAVRKNKEARVFFVSEQCHPQTISVVQTRAWPLGIKVVVGNHQKLAFSQEKSLFGILVQYPTTDGTIFDYTEFVQSAHRTDILVTVATDLMALCLLKPPGEWGADVAVGSTQRFGMPMGLGGPHAAFFATRDEFKRVMPGRLIGVSKDAVGRHAYRLSLQTREQHIRREKATSNICTAQVLPAIIAAMYAVYHGPKGLTKIALHIYGLTRALVLGLKRAGYSLEQSAFFDTIRVPSKGNTTPIFKVAAKKGFNLRKLDENHLGISIGEPVTVEDIHSLVELFGGQSMPDDFEFNLSFDKSFARTSQFLTHPVFNTHHSETEMLRYLKQLENKDLSLAHSMIPLGSCTMKLNATTEMMPVTWPGFAQIHPFAPEKQTNGYQLLCQELEKWLVEITGFKRVSLQPNAGSQGEYAGLLVIRKYHESRGEGNRKVCLIPVSAHGTNPASATMAGFQIVGIKCDAEGNVDLDDLRTKAAQHQSDLAAYMITYPSTHGVFEDGIKEMCQIIHDNGGQVYLDGANMNALVGLCRPADMGVDVCHLNLHKTFCIPHGGGGPGMGPIGVAAHLEPFLPIHPLSTRRAKQKPIGAISAAPVGSGCILPISWAYIAMMGEKGLKKATKVAILNANYIAKRLESYFPILYKGKKGWVAHECILDLREFKKSAGIEVEDVAKRLMDYGFHAPTMSWPVPGTLMVEPTESESKAELDRFCDAMISIRKEIEDIESGSIDKMNNPLKRAPHTMIDIASDSWDRPYGRKQAIYPLAWLEENKFWPSVNRVDNVYGDRNLFCSCIPMNS